MELSVLGRRVFAATGGTVFSPNQPLVVFLHGAGMDHSVWSLHTRWFAHHGRQVLAVDLPGHGRSEGPPLTSVAGLADWTAALVDAAGAGPAALAGHSLGALVALETAARSPGRVRALALLGAATAMPVHQDLLAAAKANDDAAIAMVTAWGHSFRAGLGGSPTPGLWLTGQARRLLDRAAPGVLHAGLYACHAYAGGTEAAARVVSPTTVVIGGRDRMTPAKAGRALAALIPGAAAIVLPEAGHMLMAEAPDPVLDALIPAL
jgi:pimeloyl-ACP methyl ester carboxylesterase